MSNQTSDKFYNPERYLWELIRKHAQGRLLESDQNVPVLFRATVMAVDVQGGKLENKGGSGGVTHSIDGRSVTFPARIGPENPRNSVKARIITQGLNQFVPDDRARVFWPFFPEHIAVPIKPGEHVYVLFEDRTFNHGLWICRVPGHEGVNFVKGESKFVDSSTSGLKAAFPDLQKTGSRPSSAPPPPSDKEAGESNIKDGKLSGLFGDLPEKG